MDKFVKKAEYLPSVLRPSTTSPPSLDDERAPAGPPGHSALSPVCSLNTHGTVDDPKVRGTPPTPLGPIVPIRNNDPSNCDGDDGGGKDDNTRLQALVHAANPGGDGPLPSGPYP